MTALRLCSASAVTDFRRPGSADRAALAHRERWEVVVQHELLAELVRQPIDALLIAGGAQRRRHQRLCLAALEDGRSVRSRQHADLTGDRPNLLVVPAVDALAFEDQVADHLFLKGLESAGHLPRLVLRLLVLVQQVGEDFRRATPGWRRARACLPDVRLRCLNSS